MDEQSAETAAEASEKLADVADPELDADAAAEEEEGPLGPVGEAGILLPSDPELEVEPGEELLSPTAFDGGELDRLAPLDDEEEASPATDAAFFHLDKDVFADDAVGETSADAEGPVAERQVAGVDEAFAEFLAPEASVGGESANGDDEPLGPTERSGESDAELLEALLGTGADLGDVAEPEGDDEPAGPLGLELAEEVAELMRSSRPPSESPGTTEPPRALRPTGARSETGDKGAACASAPSGESPETPTSAQASHSLPVFLSARPPFEDDLWRLRREHLVGGTVVGLAALDGALRAFGSACWRVTPERFERIASSTSSFSHAAGEFVVEAGTLYRLRPPRPPLACGPAGVLVTALWSRRRTVLVVDLEGGLHRSSDACASWHRVGGPLLGRLGAGEPLFAVTRETPARLLCSGSGGRDWREPPSSPACRARLLGGCSDDLLLSADGARVALASARAGLALSQDGGARWHELVDTFDATCLAWTEVDGRASLVVGLPGAQHLGTDLFLFDPDGGRVRRVVDGSRHDDGPAVGVAAEPSAGLLWVATATALRAYSPR